MNISPVSGALSFSAKTTIEAPESVISKEDAEKFVEIGKSVGKPTDKINITVSDIFKNNNNPPDDVYIVSTETKFGKTYTERNIILPCEVISPKDYLSRFFSKLANK